MPNARSLLLGALIASAVAGLGALRLAPVDEIAQRKAEILSPVVEVETATGSGSGTVIHSGDDGVFVLTNHHVMPAKDAADRSLKILSWIYVDPNGPALPLSQEVEIVADDEAKDLTLLRVVDPEWRSPFVARVIGPADHLQPTEEVIVVGAGLGKRVFATAGLVSLTYVKPDAPDGPAIEMLSAPTIFGNSGGAAFVKRGGHYVLAGVPEAIDAVPRSFGTIPVPHMAVAITIGAVRDFLVRAGRADLIDPPKRRLAAAGGPQAAAAPTD